MVLYVTDPKLVRVFLLFITLALPVAGFAAPAGTTASLQWPGDTTLQPTAGSRVELDRAARTIDLTAGTIDVAVGNGPVTITTGRFTVTLKQGEAWVRVQDERAAIWLKRGQAEVMHPTSGPIAMTLPMTFVEARGRTAPTPPLPVSEARARAWSAGLSEVPPSAVSRAKPPTTGSGPWAIQVASLAEREPAERLRDRLGAEGVKSTIVSADVGGATHYRVRINGFGSRAEAAQFAQEHQDLLRTDTPWITCTGRCEPR